MATTSTIDKTQVTPASMVDPSPEEGMDDIQFDSSDAEELQEDLKQRRLQEEEDRVNKAMFSVVARIQSYAKSAGSDDLSFIHQITGEELERRSPEGRGTILAADHYAMKREAYLADMAEARDRLLVVSGAITSCFDTRSGARIVKQTPARVHEEKGTGGDGHHHKVDMTIVIKDPNLGKFRMEIYNFFGYFSESVPAVNIYQYGRHVRGFEGETVEEVVDDFTDWLAIR